MAALHHHSFTTQAVLQLPATPAWDVWSLGCTLFETATGTVLFGGLEQAAAALAGADGGSSSSDGEAAGGAAWRWRGAAGSATARRRARLEALSDAAHLALVRRLLGPPPLGVLERSPLARAFYDDRGEPLRPLPGRKGLEQRLVEAGALDAAQVTGCAWAGDLPVHVGGPAALCVAAACMMLASGRASCRWPTSSQVTLAKPWPDAAASSLPRSLLRRHPTWRASWALCCAATRTRAPAPASCWPTPGCATTDVRARWRV